jgi:glycosyltransferase involved in cell wall biosynthesis
MKIFYVKGQYDFCYFYRGLLPAVYSGQGSMPFGSEPNIDHLLEADVIVFQRPSDKKSLDLAKLLKQKGKKIIFENDDTYSINRGIMLDRLENNRQRALAIEISNNILEFLLLADGVIASTPLLAKEYAETNPNVCVLKNCIDPMDVYPNKKNETGKFRIGFIGSVTTNDDYIHIKDQIKQLDDRGDVTIVVLGIKYKDGSIISFMQEDYEFWNSLKNIEWHPYCHVTEYMIKVADLALDLAIIPRNDSYFNRCKSNVKFLEMSLLKIPVLAQGFTDGQSPYQQDEDYLTIVVDNKDWYNKIINIKNDYKTYSNLAEKAHNYVLSEYNIATYCYEWTKQIEQLCKYPKTSSQKKTTKEQD